MIFEADSYVICSMIVNLKKITKKPIEILWKIEHVTNYMNSVSIQLISNEICKNKTELSAPSFLFCL